MDSLRNHERASNLRVQYFPRDAAYRAPVARPARLAEVVVRKPTLPLISGNCNCR
jgi:hypothetical protein